MYTGEPALQKVYNYYKQVLKSGAPVGVVGFQGHFYGGGKMPISKGHPQAGRGAFTMKAISECLDHLATLGKPIHITEYNPPCRLGRTHKTANPSSLAVYASSYGGYQYNNRGNVANSPCFC